MLRDAVMTKDAVAAALGDPVPTIRHAFPALAPHLTDRAKTDDPVKVSHQLTLDASLQKKLEALAHRAVSNGPPALSIAIVVANHQTGEILSSVGSLGYTQAQQRLGFVDMTRALRSPGSTLKPVVYAMSFDAGLVHPNSLIDDRPIAFGNYAPQNFDGQFRGEVRVAEALRLSLNIPVVMLTDEIGPLRLMATLRRAGVQPKLPSGVAGLAVALGGVGVTLEDLVRLYAALANGGKSVPLHWRIGDSSDPQQTVVSRSAAWQVGNILSGLAPPAGAPLNRLAYKTGTSYGYRDAWAVGYDGTHVAGVWMGRADGTPVPGAFGGELAAPILFEVFQRLKPALDPLPRPPPETLLVSTASLPQPLQHFRPRKAIFGENANGPVISFPPDGAFISAQDQALTIKVRNGKPPFTLLANGHVVVTANYAREVALPGLGQGYSDLSVIDALGQSAQVSIEIR